MQRHDFYIAEVRRRVIKQFSDVESEAERFGELEYERLSSEPSDEPNDPYDALAVIAEEATDRAEYLYELLSDLKKQTFLGALAGLYHQWDKDLRHFVERELRHNYEKSFFHKSVWDARSEASSKCFASLGGTYHLPISSR